MVSEAQREGTITRAKAVRGSVEIGEKWSGKPGRCIEPFLTTWNLGEKLQKWSEHGVLKRNFEEF